MTTRRTPKAAEPTAEPADPAATEETPGTAPDAAPGFEQDGPAEGHEPALDEAVGAAPAEAAPGTEGEDLAPYDFAEHRRRVREPWPSPDPPVIFTAGDRAAMDAFDAAVAEDVDAAMVENAAICVDVLCEENRRLDDWLLMRTQRFPQHAA